MSDSIIAIQQLQAAYCHRVDRGTASEVAALFAPDGVLKPHYDGPYQLDGRVAVESWYAFYHANFRAGVRHLKHMVMSAQIDVEGGQAQGVSYLLASAVSADSGEGFLVTGTYHDRYVCLDDQWLFAERLIEVEAMAPQGAVMETFPPLNFPRPVKG